MSLLSSFSKNSSSKLKIFFCSLFFAVFFLGYTPSVEAVAWGRSDKHIAQDGINWDGVYFDVNGLLIEAYLPNYNGERVENKVVILTGEVAADAKYIIIVSQIPDFTPPKLLPDFVKLVQDTNPDFYVNAANAKDVGSKYTTDLAPKDPQEHVYWRIMATKNRLIKMGTSDADVNRRNFFFSKVFIE